MNKGSRAALAALCLLAVSGCGGSHRPAIAQPQAAAQTALPPRTASSPARSMESDPGQIDLDPLKAVIRDRNGNAYTIAFYTPDFAPATASAPSCMANEGDETVSGHFQLYVRKNEGKPMQSELQPFNGEALFFNLERISGDLRVLPMRQGWPSDLLEVHQYMSCNGDQIAMLGLDAGGRLIQYRFAKATAQTATLFAGSSKLNEDGSITTVSYDNSKSQYRTIDWTPDEEKQLLVPRSIELKPDTAEESYPLRFQPVDKTMLQAGTPPRGWRLLKRIAFKDAAQRGAFSVGLYGVPDTDKDSPDAVRAYITDENRTIDLGEVSGYKLEGLTVQTRDMNGDGKKELVIAGQLGASYAETSVIAFDPASGRWVKLLSDGTLSAQTDLGADGRTELIFSSAGSLPGYVRIYRWQEDHYERADVAESTGMRYALYVDKGSQSWFEAGLPLKPHYFQYKDGRLVEIERPQAD